MQILKEKPPIYDKVAAQFELSGNEIFCWGAIIYNPGGGQIEPWLIDHERVHWVQQNAHPGGIEGWWDQYLEDTEFRLAQELEAHREEYKSYCRKNKDRNDRSRYLSVISRRLAGKMYGSMITPFEAKRRIQS